MSILKSRSTLADLQSNVLETEEMYYSSAFQSLFLFVKPYFLEICNILDDFYQVWQKDKSLKGYYIHESSVKLPIRWKRWAQTSASIQSICVQPWHVLPLSKWQMESDVGRGQSTILVEVNQYV